MTNKPKVGLNFYKLTLARIFSVHLCQNFIPCFLTFCSTIGSLLSLLTRVESGSDDPDNVGHLGHFFEGSSGSHPQTNLSGCDPDFLVH